MTRETMRVLIVDDNPDAVESLRQLMEATGRKVCTARDGLSALTEAEDFWPDVVLLDIAMPGLDGYEVARRLRAHPAMPGVRIIAVTGHGQPLDHVLSKEAGFDEHLVKPIDLDRLELLLR